ncbi:hypothetical protein Tco_0402970, partial [Tanacetum coccineum]
KVGAVEGSDDGEGDDVILDGEDEGVGGEGTGYVLECVLSSFFCISRQI